MFKNYAYFYVANFACEPYQISRRLGIKPTETWSKSDAWLPLKTRPCSYWTVYSPIEKAEISLDAHIEAVLDIIEPKRKQILELLTEGYDTGINCVGYYYSEHPGFNLPAKLLSRLAALSLSVDFDLYCLCADDDAL